MILNGGKPTNLNINNEIAQAAVGHYIRCIILADVSEESSRTYIGWTGLLLSLLYANYNYTLYQDVEWLLEILFCSILLRVPCWVAARQRFPRERWMDRLLLDRCICKGSYIGAYMPDWIEVSEWRKEGPEESRIDRSSVTITLICLMLDLYWVESGNQKPFGIYCGPSTNDVLGDVFQAMGLIQVISFKDS